MPMKFCCHIKIVDRRLARISFVVMHESFSRFIVNIIQASTPGDADYLSPFSLYRSNGEWLYNFETNSKQLPDYLLAEVLSELEKKLVTKCFNTEYTRQHK